MTALDLAEWVGSLGKRQTLDREAVLIERARRRQLTPREAREAADIPVCSAELDALHRASLRAMIEGVTAPLDVTRLQAAELAHAGLTLRCLNQDDLLALNVKRPGWFEEIAW